MTRAERRHHKERLANRGVRLYTDWWESARTPEERGRIRGILANHRALCSCRTCGNPRRHEKGADLLTMQERRQRDRDASP